MIWTIIIYAGFAGITVLGGGLLARGFNHHLKDSPIKSEISHTMVAMGGSIIYRQWPWYWFQKVWSPFRSWNS